MPKAKLPPTKISGNRTERLVVLSPLQSVRWLRALGYEVKITSQLESITRGNFGSIAYPGRRHVRPDEDADPQFIRFGNSKIMITRTANFGDVFMIYDQFSNPRVITYQEF